MEVHFCLDRNSIMNISIRGEIEKDEDIAYIHRILVDSLDVSRYLAITFFDASLLPSPLIDVLFKYLSENKIEIFVLKPFLYSYLYRLGISCRHINVNHSKSDKQRLPASEEIEKNDILGFLREINDCYGYDYSGYQMESIVRRLKICMLRANIKSFTEFKSQVLKDSELFESLFLHFSINTTEFFRDPEVFQVLISEIFPKLDSYPHIKIWSAGCSTGQEAYSLAITLRELNMLHKVQIYATDLNPYVIHEAKNGVFSTDDIDKHILNYKLATGRDNLLDYFEVKGSYFQISSEIQKNILFFQHSLVGSGILNEFQLILCRNVLIYFNSSLQQNVMKNFHNSLDPNGFLVLGKSEGILHNNGSNYFKSFNLDKKIFTVISR